MSGGAPRRVGRRWDPERVGRIWPPLAPDAHKGRAGRVQALVGSADMPGAALLVARAAQRAGAGLVTVLCVDPGPKVALPSAVPEAIWRDVKALFPTQGEPAPLAGSALSEGSPHARVAGCGLGNNARTRGLLSTLLDLQDNVPLVLDADALNVAAEAPERLRAFSDPLVITPHPLEAARLLGRPVGPGDPERALAARELAQRTGAIVCLKGRATVICDTERLEINDTGCAGMATAGAGDVLAGMLAAYLARAFAGQRSGSSDPFAVAALAVRCHGLAGERAAQVRGSDAVIASDLIDQLGAVQKELRGGEC